MDDALDKADWSGFAAHKSASETAGKLRGIGLSSYLEGAAPFNERMDIGLTLVELSPLLPERTPTVRAMRQFTLRWCLNSSVCLTTPSPSCKGLRQSRHGRGTVGSRSMTVGGSARFAADEIIEKGKMASHLLEAGESDIEFEDGAFSVAGTDKSIDIVEVAKMSYTPMMWPSHLGMGLDGTGTFDRALATFPMDARSLKWKWILTPGRFPSST